MDTYDAGPMTIEGRWEDVRTHDMELAGRMVKLVVLPEPAALTGEDDGKTCVPDDEIRSYPGVPDELIPLLRGAVATLQRNFRQFLAQFVEETKPKPTPQVCPEESRNAGEWLFACCTELGDPDALDNERIDADLAGEYGNSHEEPTRLPGHG